MGTPNPFAWHSGISINGVRIFINIYFEQFVYLNKHYFLIGRFNRPDAQQGLGCQGPVISHALPEKMSRV